MTTAVVGATGRVGSVVVRELLARNRPVLAIVRAPAKARQLFGQPEGLEVRQAELDGLAGVRSALRGAGTVFIAMGASGLEGNLQRITTGVQDLTGHPPRTLEDFLHENRDLFR